MPTRISIPEPYSAFLSTIPKDIDYFLVGGFIRDAIMGVSSDSPDIDIATHADNLKKIEHIAKKKGYTINKDGLKFGVITIYLPNSNKLDVAMFRDEAYVDHSRKPQTSSISTIEGDLARRDFTIGAIAYNPRTNEIIDPYNGMLDLNDKIIRAVGNPIERFKEDPLRMLRALRLATKYGYTITPDTRDAIESQRDRLDIISGERIREELLKGLTYDPVRFFTLLEVSTLLSKVFPEYTNIREVMHDSRGNHYNESLYQHILDTLMNNKKRSPITANSALFCLALLLHDIGKTSTGKAEDNKIRYIGHDLVGADMAKKDLQKFKFSSAEIKYVTTLLKYHMRVHTLESLSAKRKRKHLAELYLKLNEDANLLSELVKLTEMDGDRYNSDMYKIIEDFTKMPHVIHGEDVLDVPPKARGKLLKQMRYLQLAKSLNRAQALELLKGECNNILKRMRP